MLDDTQDYLPISMLNQFEYCERRFYLMHVMGEMEVNAHVLEGSLRHERADTPGQERIGETLSHRRIYVCSDELGIAGFADVIEETAGQLHPVEYKKGRMGKWLNDHIQLCAQALCLAERSGVITPLGYIFYFGSRQRQEVHFGPELRQRTALSIRRAQALAAGGRLPQPAENVNKCRDCSLEPVCLPREVKILKGEK